MENNLETAVLGGGCFWCLEAAFSGCKGVKEVISGYAGGNDKHPTYEMVCAGVTGHAEVVWIVFDNTIIDYKTILGIFFSLHDPTTLNRQGNDIGEQYRSIIFYNSEDQKQEAESVIKELEEEGVYKEKIVTEVKPLEEFYIAETYHQKYYQKNPEQAYCQVMISPKLNKIRAKYKEYFLK